MSNNGTTLSDNDKAKIIESVIGTINDGTLFQAVGSSYGLDRAIEDRLILIGGVDGLPAPRGRLTELGALEELESLANDLFEALKATSTASKTAITVEK